MNDFPLNYTSDVIYLKNKKLYEYDIESAGYSISISEKLIEDEELKVLLEKSDKKKRQILLGNYAKDNLDYSKNLNNGFIKYVNGFIKLNDIPRNKVLRIAKDSVLFHSDSNLIKRTKFRKANFTCRGKWSSYLRLGKIVFLYDSESDTFDVRGIGKGLEFNNTMVEFIINIMRISERGSKEAIFDILKEFRKDYISRNLEATYYKEINSNFKYQIRGLYGFDMYLEDIEDTNIDLIDINYNYINILIPLCKIFL